MCLPSMCEVLVWSFNTPNKTKIQTNSNTPDKMLMEHNGVQNHIHKYDQLTKDSDFSTNDAVILGHLYTG